MPSFITPQWPAPDNIRAYCTTRFGGFSKPPYDDFNMGVHVGDDLATVKKNRVHLQTLLQLPETPRWLTQTHTRIALQADACTHAPEADATYTQTPNVVCIAMTADCLPLLVCNTAGTEVAAIHAGWPGLCKGVISATIEALKTPGDQLMVWLGPAISKNYLQLNEEIYQQYLAANPKFAQGFSQNEAGEWFGDLYALAKINLAEYGITRVFGGEHCTYAEKDLFFSYRRDNRVTGRMASLIWLT